MTYRKKLIEVALPLDAINREASHEKYIKHGHPCTLHLWWSRKPLAACRAVLFASLVDDPSNRQDEFPTKNDQQRERERLFDLIEKLVKWENINDEGILEEARSEIFRSTNGNLPPILDPFCGSGSIPLEAQRLGMEAHASNLNPVAVLITKAMIEILPRFARQPPVNPDARNTLVGNQTWKGASGLAEDVRFYGKWMHDEAEKRIAHLYPKITLPQEQGGGNSTVIAWLWTRTAKCPNPACGARMPLTNEFWLSKKKKKQAWVEPIVDKAIKTVKFKVKSGEGLPPEGTVNRKGLRCVVCGETVHFDYVRSEGKAGRMGRQLMAIVAEGHGGRVYLEPSPEHVAVAEKASPCGVPETNLPPRALSMNIQLYGMTQHQHLFTARQLTALTTFSDLVAEARERAEADAIESGCRQSRAYADAIVTYLAFAIDKGADYWSSLCSWHTNNNQIRCTFARHAIPMVWDYAECNPFSRSSGNWLACVDWVSRFVDKTSSVEVCSGRATQCDAAARLPEVPAALISTDPPYYANIGYADLSDFFYIWLRRSLRRVYPSLFDLMLVPKNEELVATPFRFGGDKMRANEHFLQGLGKAFHLMRVRVDPNYPMTVYYAYKQSETDSKDGSTVSTGWETMLQGLLDAGFQITGTWPMRTEMKIRRIAQGANALATSIVLVCRPRPDNAEITTRRDFIAILRRELPQTLRLLQAGNIAPVDLAQAAIGPGMAVFSRYGNVLEANGDPMRVRTALQIINAELDAYFAEQEGDLDAETRFCTAWFEQRGVGDGVYGEADVLVRAKNSSVEGIAESGVLRARAGKVRLLNRDEYPDEWNPASDSRLNTWKCTQYLIRALERGGEMEAGRLVNLLGGSASENARALAYRLYAICDRKGWAQEAVPYNTLVTSWTHIQSAAASETEERPGDLF